ncbi:MAG: SPFH domain-containing protein [Clostridia bacterium]|nr:SPFH domain-containing protein [Clostridia bacterium]
MENNQLKTKEFDEISELPAREKTGWGMLFAVIFLFIAAIALFSVGAALAEENPAFIPLIFVGLLIFVLAGILASGFKLLQPNEAYVFTLFGKYYGTLKRDGFYWVNPFCMAVNPARFAMGASRKLSLKAMTLNNDKQKVNDEEGNPIEISVVVIWRIHNTARAVFNVENYMAYISTQCDAAIRQVARQYPYDVSDNGDEKSLRGSAQEIAAVLREELQQRTEMAGIEIIEARISHLAYAPEIAAAMLQRQQASAIIAARQKIVEGAVSMVQMALNKLSAEEIVELDDERKAQMVSNLLVVLCGNRDAQPVVGTGSIY